MASNKFLKNLNPTANPNILLFSVTNINSLSILSQGDEKSKQNNANTNNS